ncbi:cytochrome-c oxidase, cbb3-type subunit III [Erythrobacter aurantius]|uniref:cytochrome-c oxidase, cbb3-type subunit III n=1 Tax=Erythrobacter aurantius TaxID=2909249 RepID=UPI00207A6543|nr:cytochrome-c oxidase, cbb3-type subunit III [Erythrobacter aurantius]
MSDQKRIDEPTGTEFVGHEWDGIEELNTPLPRWWLWTFYATILFSIVYVVLYPAWPMVEKATAGTLGWSSRGVLAEEMRAAEASRTEIFERIAATDMEQLAADPELMSQAISGGAAAFKQHCVQCHGQGAAGYEQYGYPNLNDDDWIWGGDLNEIEYTLTHGIRWEGSDQTRITFMPAFAGIFDAGQVNSLVSHVRSLSGEGAGSAAGAQLFADNCAACHGPQGAGDRTQGAPALNDAIWLYGNSEANIRRQILSPRHGVMPGWSDKLDPVTIKMLAAYVHSRGGGEDFEAETPVAEPETPSDDVAQAQEDKGNGRL